MLKFMSMKGSKLMLHKFGIECNYIILALMRKVLLYKSATQHPEASGDDSSNTVGFKIYSVIKISQEIQAAYLSYLIN